MRQFDFTTNIEHRVPGTGKVFMIDRMTSDWAERHPLNVDRLIEDVYQEFAGTEFEESREALRKVWMATLSMPVQGDKSVYPNNGGASRPAAVKVWLMAGDYWRSGLRMGDVLPEKCPSTRITRLEDGGWIALFPKDLHLLESSEPVTEPVADEGSNLPKIDDEKLKSDDSDGTMEAHEPQELSLFDTDDEMTTTNAAKGDQGVTDPNATATYHSGTPLAPTLSEREKNAECRRRRMAEREAKREARLRAYEECMEREAREAEEAEREEQRKKIIAAVGAAAITLVMIYYFGLLGPAVFGLLAGGLLKG
ncbi:MAG: hypothetical protein K6F74_05915 [Prevotella sp.]|nr:hypothetical protein [Prevotella sp.]